MSHAPKVIVGALLIVAGANAWMISNAVRHPSAPASDDHWAESLEVNRAIADKQASAALGWRVELDACRPGADASRCYVHALATNAAGEPVVVTGGSLRFMRADSQAYDREVSLSPGAGAGELIADWRPAVPGLYAVEMELTGEGDARWSQRRDVRVEGRLK